LRMSIEANARDDCLRSVDRAVRYMIVFSDVLMRLLKKSLFRLKLPSMLSTRACLV